MHSVLRKYLYKSFFRLTETKAVFSCSDLFPCQNTLDCFVCLFVWLPCLNSRDSMAKLTPKFFIFITEDAKFKIFQFQTHILWRENLISPTWIGSSSQAWHSGGDMYKQRCRCLWWPLAWLLEPPWDWWGKFPEKVDNQRKRQWQVSTTTGNIFAIHTHTDWVLSRSTTYKCAGYSASGWGLDRG